MNDAGITEFHRRLHAWYAPHGRKGLPWRNTADPYAIYVSEIMLQQTQVETVHARFYAPFLARFPTLQALAKATEQDVLKAWQGLGYYSRARNLHAAAKAAMSGLPADVDALMRLPGIGRNTAHAVAAFAFRLPVAVMEANVKRVLCRIFAREEPTSAELWELAARLLDPHEPYDYNQAMMDIGATVCTPKRPRCGECPANIICEGQSEPERFPMRKARRAAPVRRKRIVLAMDDTGALWATPRPSAFLRGMYHFIELDEPAQSFTLEGTEYKLRDAEPLGSITQVYSHFTLDAEVFLLRLPQRGAGETWHPPERLPSLPWSQAELKMLALRQEKLAE